MIVAIYSGILWVPTQAQPTETFEVFSVRPSASDARWHFTLDRSQLVAKAHTLMMLIATSYPDLPLWRVSGGPSWAIKDLWDITAKLPPNMPADRQQLERKAERMLQAALADEFKVQTHFEHREQPVYELVVVKGGPKLRRSTATEFGYRATPSGMDLQHVDMPALAVLLYCGNCTREIANRFVVDETGLTDYYDFSLNWDRSNGQAETPNQQPSIYSAVQEQLGLKLQPGKGLVDFLVVDRAERPHE